MKFKVTEKGVHTQSGEKVPVGTTIELPGDKVPGYLVGKGTVVDEGHEMVVAEVPAKAEEPAKGASKSAAKGA